jgi:hypothetical protein
MGTLLSGRAVRVTAKAQRTTARAASEPVQTRAALAVGDKVKVTSKVVVFHMPKSKVGKGGGIWIEDICPVQSCK